MPTLSARTDEDCAVVTGATQAAPAGPDVTQQIRLAVVLNGGVSLAVWMSGVTHELNRLVQASRRRSTPRRTPDAYADLLDVLQADARIDVIAGTSAGGINGGFLALGLVHGCDLTGLRALWQDSGSLSTLLRNPRQKDQPSVLRGEYFHDELAKAYTKLWPERSGVPAPDGEDVDLFLTGTLWEGRRSFFADDMGRRITEVDYDATFHFTSDPEVVSATATSVDRGDLLSPAVPAQLAVASRCTASFPAAFEPFPVTVDDATVQLPDGRWPSDAGRANFQRSQFVIDGGILRNKPIRPAIDAVYKQPADQQVRRILAYVVPDPGEPATGPGKPAVTELPRAAQVMLGVLTRLRSTDSVAEELAEIERRNQETAHRRRTRDRLARTLVEAATVGAGADDLVRSAYQGYLEVRRDDTAQTVPPLLLSAPRPRPWSPREVGAELRDLAGDRDDFPFIPQRDLDAALAAEGPDWRWGYATARRLGDMVLDVLKRAVWLASLSDEHRTAIVAQRARAHELLQQLRRERTALDAYWRAAPLPDRSAELAATPAELARLRAALGELVSAWGTTGPQQDMGARLHALALGLARCLLDAGVALRSICRGGRAAVDREGGEQDRLRPLVELLVPDETTTAEGVLRRMLRLEVLHVAFTGVTDVAEQAVELVQVSSLREELVTGIQLHHFGAFYRDSWRANDWLRGRLDGSEQLVQMLLAPERLRQLGLSGEDAHRLLRAVAVGPPGTTLSAELAAAWDDQAARLTAELAAIEGDGPLPRTFPLTAKLIADRVRAELLPAELASLAAVVSEEPDPVAQAVQWAAPVRTRLAVLQDDGVHPGPAELGDMLSGSEVVGRQTVAQEAERGSDTFARTATHATASLTSSVSAVQKPRAAVSLLKALRGYAVLLWVLVNFLVGNSNLGRNVTALVVGVGGALVGLAVVVPGVPMAVPLTGVVLVLATASAAALRQRRLAGWRLAVRLLLLLLVAAVALVAVLWQTASQTHQSVQQLLINAGLRVLLLVVVLGVGWFLGRPTARDA